MEIDFFRAIINALNKCMIETQSYFNWTIIHLELEEIKEYDATIFWWKYFVFDVEPFMFEIVLVAKCTLGCNLTKINVGVSEVLSKSEKSQLGSCSTISSHGWDWGWLWGGAVWCWGNIQHCQVLCGNQPQHLRLSK